MAVRPSLGQSKFGIRMVGVHTGEVARSTFNLERSRSYSRSSGA